MTSLTMFLSRAQRDVRAGHESWRGLWLTCAASLVVLVLLCVGMVNR
jgi:hypothetical protein